MALIGSRRIARAACAVMNQDATWQRIGAGSCRVAWLHIPTGVVYKVDRYAGENPGDYDGLQEVRRFRYLYKKHGGAFVGGFCRLPLTSAFKIDDNYVVAMEYVKGMSANEMKNDHPHFAGITYGLKELRTLKFEDMHYGNYLFDEDGYVVPIDMGSPSSRTADVWEPNFA